MAMVLTFQPGCNSQRLDNSGLLFSKPGFQERIVKFAQDYLRDRLIDNLYNRIEKA